MREHKNSCELFMPYFFSYGLATITPIVRGRENQMWGVFENEINCKFLLFFGIICKKLALFQSDFLLFLAVSGIKSRILKIIR